MSTAGSMIMAVPVRGRVLLVVDMHYAVEEDNAGEKHLRRQRRVCILRCVRATCCVVSIGSPVTVTTERKTSKDD